MNSLTNVDESNHTDHYHGDPLLSAPKKIKPNASIIISEITSYYYVCILNNMIVSILYS